FDTNVQDAALRSLGDSLYLDGLIDRTDMIALLRSAEDNNGVDATELSDLNKVVAHNALFGSLDYVQRLSSYVVVGYTGNGKSGPPAAAPGLTAGSTAAQLEQLVGRWFLG